MHDLKVGDIVRFGPPLAASPSRGVITKVETEITKAGASAVVFWFKSRQRRAVNVVWLTKVEERGA